MYELETIKKIINTISSFNTYYEVVGLEEWVGDDKSRKLCIKNLIKDLRVGNRPVAVLSPKLHLLLSPIFPYEK